MLFQLLCTGSYAAARVQTALCKLASCRLAGTDVISCLVLQLQQVMAQTQQLAMACRLVTSSRTAAARLTVCKCSWQEHCARPLHANIRNSYLTGWRLQAAAYLIMKFPEHGTMLDMLNVLATQLVSSRAVLVEAAQVQL